MELEEIVTFWSAQRQTAGGQWIHPDDEAVFSGNHHSFNLDHPVGPYVGNIVGARVIILGANGGYDPVVTPAEFPSSTAIREHLARIASPSACDWSGIAPYYADVNYGQLLLSGDAALINACAYRSPRVSAESENLRLVKQLLSVAFIKRWLAQALVPRADRGERLVVAKRPGLWDLPHSIRSARGFVVDPAPISKHVTSEPWAHIQRFIAETSAM